MRYVDYMQAKNTFENIFSYFAKINKCSIDIQGGPKKTIYKYLASPPGVATMARGI